MACEAPEWDYDPRLFLSDSSQMASKAKRPPEVSSIEPGDPGTWPLATMQVLAARCWIGRREADPAAHVTGCVMVVGRKPLARGA